jgi:Polysaccharide lyase
MRRAPNILRTAAAVLALAAIPAPAASADVVFDGRWSTPGVNHWDQVLELKPGNGNRLRFVTDPRRRSAGYAADLRVGGNDRSERIEFQKGNLLPSAEGTDQWWAWSFYIARDSAIPSVAFLTQANSRFNGTYCSISRGGASNSLRMMSPDRRRRADRWYWTAAGGRGSCKIAQLRIPGLRVVKHRWIDFLCHFRWSSTASGRSTCGYRVQPRRGWRRAFDYRGPNLVSSPDADGNLRIAQGVYKAEAPPYVHVIQGGLVIADTRAEAANAAFGNARPPNASSAARPGDRIRTPLIGGALAAIALLAAFVVRRHAPHGHRRLR